MRHASLCNNSDCVFDIIIFWHFRRCPPCTRQPYKNVNRIVIRHCSSPFCFFVLARVAGIEPACLPLGDQGGRQLPYYTRISKPTAQERWRGGATRCGRACCFWPEQVEQGVSALTLRRTRSRHIHAGTASARTAARFFIGLERKGGRCCTAPLRRARRLTSWPCPAFMESVKQAQAGSGPAHDVPVPEGHPAPHKKQPRFCGQGCLLFHRGQCFVSAASFPS